MIETYPSWRKWSTSTTVLHRPLSDIDCQSLLHWRPKRSQALAKPTTWSVVELDIYIPAPLSPISRCYSNHATSVEATNQQILKVFFQENTFAFLKGFHMKGTASRYTLPEDADRKSSRSKCSISGELRVLNFMGFLRGATVPPLSSLAESSFHLSVNISSKHGYHLNEARKSWDLALEGCWFEDGKCCEVIP